MVNRRITSLALAASLGLGLVACGSSAHLGAAAGIPQQAHFAGEPGQRHGPCPQGRLLPPGVGEAVDYVDFFQLGGRSYEAVAGTVGASQLGPVIGHIRCSLAASEDPGRGPAPVIDGTASFLPAGAPIYEVRGYSPACRLAAYLDGRLQLYFAQATGKGQSPVKPASCAVEPGQRS
jgi:hypothetical protein